MPESPTGVPMCRGVEILHSIRTPGKDQVNSVGIVRPQESAK